MASWLDGWMMEGEDRVKEYVDARYERYVRYVRY